MGWQLVREAEDHGPDSLTWRERFALSVLANAAIDETRECPHIEDRPDIIRRLRLGRSERFAVISALCDKGALIQVERGRNNKRAVYAIAPFVALAQLAALANGSKRPGNPDPRPVDNGSAPVGNGLKGPGFPDARRLKGPGFPDAVGDKTLNPHT